MRRPIIKLKAEIRKAERLGFFQLLAFGLLALPFYLLPFWNAEARAADLLNIRFGWHSTFARVVFDFDEEVAYKMEGDSTRGDIRLEFFGASLSELSQILLGKLDGEIIGALRVQKLGENRVTAEITPKGNFTVKAFHFSEGPIGKEHPFKVVVDVYGSPKSESLMTLIRPDDTDPLLTPATDGERGGSVRSVVPSVGSVVPKSESLEGVVVAEYPVSTDQLPTTPSKSLQLGGGKVQVGQPEENITKITPPHHSGESEKIRGDLWQRTLGAILYPIRGGLKTALAVSILCALVFLAYRFVRKIWKGWRGTRRQGDKKTKPDVGGGDLPLSPSPPLLVGSSGGVERSIGNPQKEKKYELAGQLAAGGWSVREVAKELQMGQREVELVKSLKSS